MIKNSNLKERLRRYLDVKGMKTAELARITGIVPNSLSDLMTGKKKGMNSDQVEIIIKTTDVNPLFLLTGEGPVIRSVNAQHLDGPTAEEITVAALAVEGSTTRFTVPASSPITSYHAEIWPYTSYDYSTEYTGILMIRNQERALNTFRTYDALGRPAFRSLIQLPELAP